MYSSQLLKGTFETIVLKLLSENDRLYGYELIQKVKDVSEGDISIPYGSIYPLLHKLESDGLVSVERVKNGKRVRRYYTITNAGKDIATERVEEFMRFARTMIQLLRPQTA
ncbi:MAG: PadR family transcriptional regulator [Cyclobacteriaceae bacterium]